MPDLEKAIAALNEYDERRRRAAAAFLKDMPAVDRYIADNAEVWEERHEGVREVGAAG